ncbi:lipoprotein-releasing system ATP-binding protein [Candidatus Electrothrix marina]|uniref:Lipoprotein-releasing system ATP-binding protein n=1 Tax=Candidatus Electrothrix marina TaxID=1859130 RepID=A0A444J7V9_9BACT|nr:lipoprotein-releasing system ATP-binding protein [Candidatus Electrothrix marina]
MHTEHIETKSVLLQAVNIHKSYGTKENPVQVLRRVNLEITPGEMLAVVGASGSGKTTLLQILGSLDIPDKGEIWFDGQGLNEFSENQLAAHRNKNIGFIFQFHYLLPEFSALENVMMPGLIAGLPVKKLEEDAHRLLKQVGLGHRITHRSGELSGGEQQRVALARHLSCSLFFYWQMSPPVTWIQPAVSRSLNYSQSFARPALCLWSW